MFGGKYTMITKFKDFPLGIRIALIFGILVFNLALFQWIATLIITPILGEERLIAIGKGIFAADGDRYAFLFLQGVSSLGMFAFSALLVSQLETPFVSNRLGFNVKPTIKVIALAIFAILAAQLLIQFLVEVNEKIPLPAAWKSLLELQKKEDDLMNNLLKGTSFNLFLVNIVVLAIIPAVGEEMFFRGLLLGELLKSKVKPLAAIIFSGFVFSLLHGEYNNFVAIWVLGCFLGFLFYLSGSIWVSVSAHFVNNILVVLFKYLYNTGLMKADVNDVEAPIYITIISILLFMAALWLLNKERRPLDFALVLNGPIPTDEEEEDYI